MPKKIRLSSIDSMSVMSSSAVTFLAQRAMTLIALPAMSLFDLEANSKSPSSIGTISPFWTFHLTRVLKPPAPPFAKIQSSPSYS